VFDDIAFFLCTSGCLAGRLDLGVGHGAGAPSTVSFAAFKPRLAIVRPETGETIGHQHDNNDEQGGRPSRRAKVAESFQRKDFCHCSLTASRRPRRAMTSSRRRAAKMTISIEGHDADERWRDETDLQDEHRTTDAANHSREAEDEKS